MSKRLSILIQVLIVLIALGGSVYVALAPANSLMNWYNIDDAFYYYKVAQNVIAGHGFTFDGINQTNGFHPLWMVVCLTIFWLGNYNLILPLRVLAIVSGLFNAATALVLYRLLSKFLHPFASILGSLTWALLPAIYGVTTVHGMESSISAFFIVLLLYQAVRFLSREENTKVNPWQMALLGLVGALTILSRLDNIFVVASVGLFVLFRIRKISPALIYDWAALALAVVLSWILRLGSSNVEQNMYSIYPMIGIAFTVFPTVYYFFGIYDGFSQKSIRSKVIRQFGAAIVNFIIMMAFEFVLNKIGILRTYSRSVITIFAVIAFVFVLCLRLFQRKNSPSREFTPFRDFAAWVKRVWKEVLLEGIAYSLPIGVIVGIYCLFNKLFFGTFTPVSGQIKTWWSTLPNTVYSHPNTIISILGLSPIGSYGPWSLLTSRINAFTNSLLNLVGAPDDLNSFLFILLTVLFVFLVAAFFKAENNKLAKKFFNLLAPAVFMGCLTQIAYYTTIGYAHTRVWYWVSEALVITLLGSVLLDGFLTWLGEIKPISMWAPSLVTVGIAALLMFTHVRYLKVFIPMTVAPGQETAYLNEVKQVESLTPQGSKIGMTGGGLIAYFIEKRTVVNMDGLINSADYFHAMKNGTARNFLDAIPLNYVYGNEYVVTESDPYKSILNDRLRKVGMIRGYENFTLYKYVINQ
jgi:hypothetical protein